MNVETILKRFGNVSNIFDKKGDLTIFGNECYKNLIATITDLGELGILDKDSVGKVINELDKLVNLEKNLIKDNKTFIEFTIDNEYSINVVIFKELTKEEFDTLEDCIASYIENVEDYQVDDLVEDVLNSFNFEWATYKVERKYEI